jgi:hypothetical protein
MSAVIVAEVPALTVWLEGETLLKTGGIPVAALTAKLSTRDVPAVPTVPPEAEVVELSTKRKYTTDALFKAVIEERSFV